MPRSATGYTRLAAANGVAASAAWERAMNRKPRARARLAPMRSTTKPPPAAPRAASTTSGTKSEPYCASESPRARSTEALAANADPTSPVTKDARRTVVACAVLVATAAEHTGNPGGHRGAEPPYLRGSTKRPWAFKVQASPRAAGLRSRQNATSTAWPQAVPLAEPFSARLKVTRMSTSHRPEPSVVEA